MYICICVCCYSSRLAVVYVPSIISSIALSAHSKVYGRVYVFPFRDDVFCLVTKGFTSAYVRIQSMNIRRHIKRRHVNRKNSVSKHHIQPQFGE